MKCKKIALSKSCRDGGAGVFKRGLAAFAGFPA